MKRRGYIFTLVFLLLIIGTMPDLAFAELKFKWGSRFRLRYEFLKNVYDMDSSALDNLNFFKLKSSLWGQVDFNKDISFYTRFTNEFRSYTYYAPSPSKAFRKTDKSYPFDINEVVFDNFYFDVKNFFGFPLDLCLGRQDLNDYGEGFLIYDGTPGDGSRTYYFNAAKAVWRINDTNSADFIYLNDPRSDVFLPVINRYSPRQNLTTTEEKAGILYLKSRSIQNVNLEGYYIYKREGGEGGTGLQKEKGIINTLGSFVKYNFSPYTLRAQLASQFGTYGNKDRQALGGYVFLDRSFNKFFWSPKFTFGFFYLSGGDTASDKDRAWDPLFSRYGIMSELYTQSYKTETGIKEYWTNLQLWRGAFVLKPTEKLKINLLYNYLRANKDVSQPAATFSGRGKNRGHLPQARIDYAFNDYVSGYFLAEYFIPGNFYTTRDDAVYLRTQLQVQF
ncbi:MAG: alginate export family protein [Candidatus Omnitrophica bacterium]|nr:alginate export family protein [Candidatus Omnitrophota bacterium]